MSIEENNTVMGKVTSVYGIKGWVKVFSYAQPKENICRYKVWSLEGPSGTQQVKVSSVKAHGNGFVAQFEGSRDRNQAELFCGSLVKISQSDLPELSKGDYYWHQLNGLNVFSGDILLGKVSHMLETGANDVLVVKRCKNSIDSKERLIPYLPDQVIKLVDLENGLISVDWDPEF